MTATPIPRTAAMTVYGDLDVTVLDELPPGRTPVTTRWARGPLEESEAWERVRTEVAAGHQAYVVCPLIEESEKIQARSATEEYERLRADVFPDLRVGPACTARCRRPRRKRRWAPSGGTLDVLVATTVIEVGVDVPNATVMVIEDADRFGIAQLHQLRGRVGRGADQSWCYLLGGGTTPESEERLEAMERTTDGFELAEVDLELRGEGTILGTRQKGRSDLKLASLRRGRSDAGRAVGWRSPSSTATRSWHQPRPGRRGRPADRRGRGRVPVQVAERVRAGCGGFVLALLAARRRGSNCACRRSRGS